MTAIEIIHIKRKTAGEIAYSRDLAAKPTYHDGSPRKTWAQLDSVERLSWERNPTPRTYSK